MCFSLSLQAKVMEMEHPLTLLQGLNTEAKVRDIHIAIQRDIEQMCMCGFTTQHLSDSEFQCFADLDEVTFRAKINGTVNAASSEIIGYIELWIEGEITIRVQSVRLSIDSTCYPVAIVSYADARCMAGSPQPTEPPVISPSDYIESPTESPTSDDTESPTQAAQSDNTAAITGGVVVAVVLIVVIAITVIAIVILVLKNRRASITLQKEG